MEGLVKTLVYHRFSKCLYVGVRFLFFGYAICKRTTVWHAIDDCIVPDHGD